MKHTFLKGKIFNARRNMEFYYIKKGKKEKLDESFKGKYCLNQTKEEFEAINKEHIGCKADPGSECPHKSLEGNNCSDLDPIILTMAV